MCYDDVARPPLPPIRGAASDSGDIHLGSDPGVKLMAHFARAAQPTGAGMVVLPDVRGLHGFYKELAGRFAEAGIDAVAIDYFARTAGDGSRAEGFEYMPHVQQATPEGIAADTHAGIEWLRSQEGGAVRSVFTVGFCWGGSNSWNQSAAQPGLSGAIGFYGRPERSRRFIGEMRAPLLMLLAGNDAATPQDEFERFDQELAAAGVTHDMTVYPGAPHSFFDRTYEEWRDACADAWTRILDFVKRGTPLA
ncbi:MAG: dienelactone hydrolase family protein [Candidatus Dormibacteraeota bacterium]|nr:dienelactone hydrolase family protein [Candidatus Dormibacteraeota bacterium]